MKQSQIDKNMKLVERFNSLYAVGDVITYRIRITTDYLQLKTSTPAKFWNNCAYVCFNILVGIYSIDPKYVKYPRANAKKPVDPVLKNAVLEVMKHWDEKRDRGWWYGYEELADYILDKFNIIVTEPELRPALKQLHKEGKVYVTCIFNEQTGMLNGSGYFYNHQKQKS